MSISRFVLVAAASLVSFLSSDPRLVAAEPEVSAEADEGWFSSTYRITMNKGAALKLQNALDRADPDLIGGALTAAAPHPALKVAAAVVTSNADAFKRRLNKEGTIGKNGIVIVLKSDGGTGSLALSMVTHGGVVGGAIHEITRRVIGAALNPWSWDIETRE